MKEMSLRNTGINLAELEVFKWLPSLLKLSHIPISKVIVDITFPIPMEPVKRNENWCDLTAAFEYVRKSAAAVAPLDCRTWDTMGCMKHKTSPCLKRNN